MPRPYDAKTLDDVCDLRRDNYPPENGVWSILITGDAVSLHPPGGGGYTTIPRDQFNTIVRWYMRDQKPLKTKRPA